MGIWAPGPGGTSGNDTFNGDGTNEIADGLDGDDTLNGEGGDDTLTGGLGVDIVNGGDGNDVLIVDETHDGAGDTYNGGADTDTLRVEGTGTNQFYLFQLDTLSSIERLQFGSTTGNVATVTLTHAQLGAGLSLNANLVGSVIINYFRVDSSTIHTGLSLNFSGFTFTDWGVQDLVTVLTGDGADSIIGSSQADHVYTYGGNDTVYGGGGNDLLSGLAGADFLDGGDGLDSLLGGDDADTLYGRAGDDYLSGEAGADTMYGGDGNDQYFVESIGDLVIENGPAGGSDTVYSTITYTLGAGVEILYLIDDAGAINGTGNELANLINGTTDANILNGRAGNDILSGGSGDDTIYGGDGNDDIDGGAGADLLDGGSQDDDLLGGMIPIRSTVALVRTFWTDKAAPTRCLAARATTAITSTMPAT